MIIKKFKEENCMFDALEKNVTYQTLFTDIYGKGSVSYFIKELIIIMGNITVPIIILIALGNTGLSSVPSENKWQILFLIALISGVIIVSFIIWFILKRNYKPKFLNKLRFRLLLIGLLELSAITYGSAFLNNIFPHVNLISLSLLLISYFMLSLWLIKIILDVNIKKTLNKSYEQNFKISKFANYLHLYPAFVLAIIVFGTYSYRVTKSAFIVTHNEPVSLLYSIVGEIGFLFIALSISLLPTLLFDGELYVRGKLLQNHSEHFRIEYEFTEREWYLGDWNE